MSETSGQCPEAQIMAQLVGLPLIKVNSIFNFLLNGSKRKLDIIHLQALLGSHIMKSMK